MRLLPKDWSSHVNHASVSARRSCCYDVASILISGIELITKEPIGSREITIISVAIGLGYGLGATTGATSHLPYYVQLIFGGSGIVPCSLCAILLNIILPKKSKNAPYMWDMDEKDDVKRVDD